MSSFITRALTKRGPIIFAILAAALYGISSPVAKVLLDQLSPYVLAACLYLGAGLGMSIISLFKRKGKAESQEAKIPRNEWIYVLGMILLDIAAPIFLMLGLSQTNAGTASLLNNFEIVITSLLAMVLFKEAVGKRMWIAIGLISIATMILSMGSSWDFTFTPGAIWILLATMAWGLENNCTRMLSLNDPMTIVMMKGFGSGVGALLVGIAVGNWTFSVFYVLIALLLGFVAYGLSILLYIYAQRDLGAARTSAYYAAAPFIGVLASWIFLHEPLSLSFGVSLLIMLAGTYFAVSEDHGHRHAHEPIAHHHKHRHDDLHHDHIHSEEDVLTLDGKNEHIHEHHHQTYTHQHPHWPDLHHRHAHETHAHETHAH